jgi:hypothetical protein
MPGAVDTAPHHPTMTGGLHTSGLPLGGVWQAAALVGATTTTNAGVPTTTAAAYPLQVVGASGGDNHGGAAGAGGAGGCTRPAGGPGAGSGAVPSLRHLSWRGITATGRHLAEGLSPHLRGIAPAVVGMGELDLLHGSASQWRLRQPKGPEAALRVEVLVHVNDEEVLRRLGTRIAEWAPPSALPPAVGDPFVPTIAPQQGAAADACPAVGGTIGADDADAVVEAFRGPDVVAIVSAVPNIDGQEGRVLGVWSGSYAIHAAGAPIGDGDTLPSLSATQAGLDAAVAWNPLCVAQDTPATNCKLQLAAVALHMVSHERFLAALAATSPSRFQTVVQVYKTQVEALTQWCAWPLPYAVVARDRAILELALDWPLPTAGWRH